MNHNRDYNEQIKQNTTAPMKRAAESKVFKNRRQLVFLLCLFCSLFLIFSFCLNFKIRFCLIVGVVVLTEMQFDQVDTLMNLLTQNIATLMFL